MTLEETTQIIPLDISLVITQKNSKPAIELRKVTTDEEIIKQIISAAFHNRTAIIKPTFTNQFKAISTLIDKGIIYKEKEQYFFTI